MTVCEINKCSGCMACVSVCVKKAIHIEDTLESYNSVIDNDKCIRCSACTKVCPQNNSINLYAPKKWIQGWSCDEKIRQNASSGGFATAISTAFIKNFGIVYGCTLKNGEFVFDRATVEGELGQFVGSKYVKSNPIHVYNMIKEDLANDKNVLFIGLPCQVAGIKKVVGRRLDERLYTIDLICHGTPSPKLLKKFLSQYGIELSSIKDIKFRKKTGFQIYKNNKGVITNGVSDKYSIAFSNTLINTENCYSCNYAKIERLSDVTIGDSWGSELPVSEQKKGISLALIQTEKGNQMIEDSDLVIEDVDLETAIKNNHQLAYPSAMKGQREKFFKQLKMGKNFNGIVFRCLLSQCLKQDVKHLLIRLGLYQKMKKCIFFLKGIM